MKRNITGQDVFDISAYLIDHVQDYIDLFHDFGTYLTLEDFLKERLALDLKLKYNKYQIEEAFEDPRMILIMDFYTVEPTEYDNLH